MAISGNGFFTLDSPSGYVYTRNGEFTEDQNGNVTTATGQFLQVYPPLANGGFNTGALQNLNLNTAQSAPQATSTGVRDIEPAVDDTVPTAAPFDPTNSDHLLAIDLDHGLRLARQLLSGDLLLHTDHDAWNLGCQHDGERHRGGSHPANYQLSTPPAP